MGWLQSVRELGIDVQELHATVPCGTLHDGVRGHLWSIDLQALRAEGLLAGWGVVSASSLLSPQRSSH